MPLGATLRISMSNRQISWRRIAEHFGGSFRIKTGATQSRFFIDFVARETVVEIRGTSVPYSVTGGSTKIWAVAEIPLGGAVRLRRFAPYFNPFVRDIRIGDECFDRDWIIQSRKESHAQALLGKKQRGFFDSVTDTNGDAALLKLRNVTRSRRGPNGVASYSFEAKGRSVFANFERFDTDEERLLAAITATIALAQRPKTLLEEWEEVALQLGGRLKVVKRWRDDGSTRIVLAKGGSRVIISPVVDKLGWRRLRLRTRVSCECKEIRKVLHYCPGDAAGELSQEVLAELVTCKAIVLRCDGQRVWVDLDGNVTDVLPLRAATRLVTFLAKAESGGVPYR